MRKFNNDGCVCKNSTNSSEPQVTLKTYMVFQTCPYACGFGLFVMELLPLEMNAVLGF
ncbi:MAG: hypothetical protein PUP91_13485 [Rhizonema sp. PD37]|nr:hypothetical protein [Rhizonema sp. PD37]